MRPTLLVAQANSQLFTTKKTLYLYTVPQGFLYHHHNMHVHETKGVVVPNVQTADSCLGLIGPRQCSAALGGPATSNSRPKAPQGLKKSKRASKYLCVS